MLACDYFAKPPKAVDEERIYNATADGLLALVGETGRARSLLLTGHNPGFHDLAVALIASGDVAARERLHEKLPTTGLVVIDLALNDWALVHPHSGRLERFVSPRLIAATTE
jgi:phosphohistidine phosphatase